MDRGERVAALGANRAGKGLTATLPRMSDRNVIEPRPLILKLRERKRRHKRRSKLVRIPFAIAAVVVILLGLLLSLPGVPGPGLVLVAVGLGMLALEFDRAERLLEVILDRIGDVAEEATPLQKALLLAVGAAAAIGTFVAVLVWDVPYLPV